MKILVINNSGNVGKSFISRELLYPNLIAEDKKIIEIESNNSSSSAFKVETLKISGNDFETLNRQIMMNDDLVLDLGASQIEKFFAEFQQNDSILEEIDFIIVPVIPNIKEIEDTLVLLEILKNANLGIRIEIILNRCQDINKYKFFIDEAKERGFNIDTNLQLQDYKAIAELEENKYLTNEILGSEKDFKALAKESYKANNIEEADMYSDMYLLQKQSVTIRKDLDQIYALLIAKG